ncbi:hypothetical protein [Gallaecimonas pentaromativorans]|uniref:Uncharacterized protein n=1 Tax=Gallaecimonas pentaromativorans TaxID=584787 RepID=A0A3N1P8D9_9GAMM|nr:hypothetical protein [Gallaecimonas pentaromativorans]ROQ24803.1 hypothetical protein EDC28_10650 [Gallaecimonas pentaromativorans]
MPFQDRHHCRQCRQRREQKSALFNLSGNVHLLLFLATGGLWLLVMLAGYVLRPLQERLTGWYCASCQGHREKLLLP